MTLQFIPFAVVYLVSCMLLIDVAVAIDIRRRKLPWWPLALPVVFGPPGGMAYFIARPPMAQE